MEFKTITFSEIEPQVGLLTLNRPEKLNAINLDMLEEFHQLHEDLQDNREIRVVVMTGAGRAFCSGADLTDERMHARAPELFSDAPTFLVRVQKKYANLVMELKKWPQPIIAAVNGVAAGGGMCLALSSDLILAGPKARFIASFINLGLSGGELGTSYYLPRMVGVSRAAEILYTGRPVDAEEAERIGLVSRMVAEDRLLESALELARVMLSKSPIGLRLTKEVLTHNLTAPNLESAIELENRNQSLAAFSPDFAKAVTAFAEKKPA